MDFKQILLMKILAIPAILIAFTFRQYAQARVAVKLGDETPRLQGRLTLNPLSHIDPMGFIMIVLIGFGWAKPIETDPRSFKNYYKDDLKVNLAGMLASIIIGFIASILLVLIIKFFPGNTDLSIIISTLVKNVAVLNCMWFFLWLLPIPGFDGFYIIRDLFPEKFYKYAEKLLQYQFIIFLFLIMPIFGGMSVLDIVVGIPGSFLYNSFIKIATFFIM